jgi:hypothetical protein
MLDNGSRGELVGGNVKEITSLLNEYFIDQARFDKKSAKALEWARSYTLERFEVEIGGII